MPISINGSGTIVGPSPTSLGTSAANSIFVDSSGNIGIGTSTMLGKLTVPGNIVNSGGGLYGGSYYSTYANHIDVSGSPTQPQTSLWLTNGTQTGAVATAMTNLYGTRDIVLSLNPDSVSGYGAIENYNSSLYLSTGPSNSIIFATNRTERMRIDSSGNLGIGSSPGYKLDILSSNFYTFRITPSVSTNGVASFASNAGGNFSYGIDASTGANFGAAYGAFLWHSGAYPILFGTNNTERMRLDSSGNLGLGVAPSAWATFKAIDVGTIGSSFFGGAGCQTGVSCNAYYNNSGFKYATTGNFSSMYLTQNGIHAWYNAPSGTAGNPITFTQVMTLDASGNLSVGTTSVLGSALSTFVSTLRPQMSLRSSGAASGKYWRIWADDNNSFSIYNNNNAGTWMSDGGTSWNSSSDEQLKNIIAPISDALDKVSTLRSVTFKWKNGYNDAANVGLIAQDVQAVLPEAVSEAPDGYLGLSYTSVIPLLVAAIKELSAKLDEANARIKALESK